MSQRTHSVPIAKKGRLMLLNEISLLIITVRRITYIHSLGKKVKCLNVTHHRTGTCSHHWDLSSEANRLELYTWRSDSVQPTKLPIYYQAHFSNNELVLKYHANDTRNATHSNKKPFHSF